MASKKVDRNSVVLGKNSARTSRLGIGQRAVWFAAAGISLIAFAGCAADLENPDENFSAAYASASAGATGASGGSGGGGGGGMMVVVPPDPPCWQTLKSQCVGCHVAGNSLSAGLDLTLPNLSATLVNKTATYDSVADKSKCKAGALIFDPVTPANGVMLKKMKGTQDCGLAMPFGATASTLFMGEQLKCFEDWANGFKVVAANVLTPDSSDGSDANNP